jgi:hypothetical protein
VAENHRLICLRLFPSNDKTAFHSQKKNKKKMMMMMMMMMMKMMMKMMLKKRKKGKIKIDNKKKNAKKM